MNYLYTLGIILALGNATLCATEEIRNGIKRTISATEITFEQEDASVTWYRQTNHYSALIFVDEDITRRISPRGLYIEFNSRFHDDSQGPGNS